MNAARNSSGGEVSHLCVVPPVALGPVGLPAGGEVGVLAVPEAEAVPEAHLHPTLGKSLQGTRPPKYH